MIERYATPETSALWSDEARLARYLRVWLAVLEAEEAEGLVPDGTAAAVRGRLAALDAADVLAEAAERERSTGHDVIALLETLEARAGEEGRWLHYGLTSSDVLDTAGALALTAATDTLREAALDLAAALMERAKEHRATPVMGRTHGVYAEPTTLGKRLLSHYAEVRRSEARLAAARAEVSHAKLSGAVGTYGTVSPALETRVLEALGLSAEPVSTQVVPRDRHAALLVALAFVGAALERLALTVRLGARTGTEELFEPFGRAQRGSSAMPHKRNPVLCERLSGIARLLRGYAFVAFENVALWEERDISHSSVERVVLPDATTLAHYALRLATEVVRGLDVDAERMRASVEEGDLYRSGALLTALVAAGMSRGAAYGLVQAAVKRGVPLAEAARDGEIAERLGADGLARALSVDYMARATRAFDEALDRLDRTRGALNNGGCAKNGTSPKENGAG